MKRSSALITLGALATLAVAASALAKPRVVIIGFDGADAALTRKYMDEGKLPHLEALAESGVFRPLETTNPPQTPVSWSTFATGLNPGRTTIFDFLRRTPKRYTPEFALVVEGSEPFLWGERNPLVLGFLGALAGLVIGALLGFAVRRAGRPALLSGVALALLAGAGTALFARTYLPVERPVATNKRQGETMWETAARAGLRTTTLRVPATFPAKPVAGGEFLSGLGVPDVRGTVGTFSFYTTTPLEASEDTEFGGKVVELAPFEKEARAVVFGPRNKLFYKEDPKTRRDPEGDPKEINLPLRLTKLDGRLALEVSGQTVTLAPGDWSDWVELTFPFNRVVKLKGIARFHLLALEPHLQLYLSPINLHPKSPPLPISYPADYAWDLKQEIGWYKTLGWAIDTWSYNEERVTAEDFLYDVEATVAKYEALLEAELTDSRSDLYIQVFNFTDRVAHVFFRMTDPDHPAYDPDEASRYGAVIEDAYVRMDRIVGRALELVGSDPETLFMVVSDHGFSTWRRSVNYNTWLVKNGFMTLRTSLGGRKLTLEDLFGNKAFFPHVDWSRTKAYSLGLGNLYINLRGREPKGVVAPGAEYDQVVTDLVAGLESYVDPDTGENPVRKVYRRDEMYRGYNPSEMADLRIANSRGYRVSWQSSLGATPPEVIQENTQNWSGDHCSLDPSVVPGIFFANRPIESNIPGIVDIAPTVLKVLGLEPPAELDGKPLL